jgi:hypothetical protein
LTSDVELWLYGSRARGDADEFSDTDVLAVGDAYSDVEQRITALIFPRLNVSFYSWNEIEAMREYGSLYLHHIAQEGQLLQADANEPTRLSLCLADLPPFARAREDLAGFMQALAESRASLSDGGWPDFECQVVATIARHAAILAAYCVGEPAFGRERPFRIAGAALGYSKSEIDRLVIPATWWRLHGSEPNSDQMMTEPWLDRVYRFLNDLQQVVDEYSTVLQRAA